MASYSELIEKDTVVLYGSESSKTTNSYFEFKETGDFTLYTDRRSEYDSTNQLTEQLITRIPGTYQPEGNSLKLVFNKPHELTTTRTYLMTFKSKDELRLINKKRNR